MELYLGVFLFDGHWWIFCICLVFFLFIVCWLVGGIFVVVVVLSVCLMVCLYNSYLPPTLKPPASVGKGLNYKHEIQDLAHNKF